VSRMQLPHGMSRLGSSLTIVDHHWFTPEVNPMTSRRHVVDHSARSMPERSMHLRNAFGDRQHCSISAKFSACPASAQAPRA